MCTAILHLFPYHRIIIPVPVIRALIIPVRHDPHIVILVHIHITQICPVHLIIYIEGACFAASMLFSLHFVLLLFSHRASYRIPALYSPIIPYVRRFVYHEI